VKPVVSVEEMRRVDATMTADLDEVMKAAGNGVALSAVKMGVRYGDRVHVIAGKGNNGGDGYVAARYLDKRGAAVTVHQVGVPDEGTAAHRALQSLSGSRVVVQPISAPESVGLVIDAFVGTGFRGELPQEVGEWTESGNPVLSVDVPSGIDGDTGMAAGPVFTATRTATFHMYKPAHFVGDGPQLCGDVDLYDIGLTGGDPEMLLFEDSDVVVPSRAQKTHKWSAGSVATIGGVPGLTGAALFAARAAIAAGAGASVLLTTAATADTYAAVAPDIPQMLASESEAWKGGASEVLALLDRFDVLIMGPGLEPVASDFVERILAGFDGAVILDAGGLNALTGIDVLSQRSAPTILTPHGGEFKRLTGYDPGHDAARWLAEDSGTIVLLKGNPTFVVSEQTVIVNSGGPELATIGTGDVLAGIIAAFISGGVDPATAAASAAHLHGIAGANVSMNTMVTSERLIESVAGLVAELGTG